MEKSQEIASFILDELHFFIEDNGPRFQEKTIEEFIVAHKEKLRQVGVEDFKKCILDLLAESFGLSTLNIVEDMSILYRIKNNLICQAALGDVLCKTITAVNIFDILYTIKDQIDPILNHHM